MAELNRPTGPNSFLEEPRKVPEMLNVLTILTFIGSGLFSLGSLYNFATARQGYETMRDAQDKLDQMPDFAKRFMSPDMLEMARRSLENRTPILLLTLVSYALCVYGAIQMRQLKKNGFYIYVLGEIVVPLIASFVFIGAIAFSSVWAYLGICIYIIFIVLYATQLKYLK